ncbi:MAG: hypothetical protein H0V17_26220 [Deltaproteobacteria bacterium]|nr:hypothetical protein [Deltaproteobacteria bacterium]
MNVGDPVAVVGTELVLDLDGTDPDGDRLSYRFEALDLADLDTRATIALTPSGSGVFRWTPLASDLGEHAIDFVVSDGALETTITVTITVVDPITAPIFRAPLGSGTTLDLDVSPCLEVEVVVEDPDSTQVQLAHLDEIGGATLDQRDGLSATWSWCPTVEQRAVTRHTLVISADDGEHPRRSRTTSSCCVAAGLRRRHAPTIRVKTTTRPRRRARPPTRVMLRPAT